MYARVERTKQVERETHSLFGHTPARRRLKSRRSFLTSVQPVHFPAKVVRVNEWKRRLEEKAHAGLVNLYEDLATGHDIPWLNWRCLNRLRTGYTCSKEQRKKWGYFNGDTTCECGLATENTPRTPLHLGRPSRVQRYSSSMHRAMEEDCLMIRHDDDDRIYYHIPDIYTACALSKYILLFKFVWILINVRKIVFFCIFICVHISLFYSLIYIFISVCLGVSLCQSDIEVRHAHYTISRENRTHGKSALHSNNFQYGSVARNIKCTRRTAITLLTMN